MYNLFRFLNAFYRHFTKGIQILQQIIKTFFWVNFFSVDGIPPQVTCPADISHEIPFGTSGRQVSWSLPTITENAGSFTLVSSTNNPNDVFRVGSFLVTYTYRDTANNIGTCSFTVTITTGTVSR